MLCEISVLVDCTPASCMRTFLDHAQLLSSDQSGHLLIKGLHFASQSQVCECHTSMAEEVLFGLLIWKSLFSALSLYDSEICKVLQWLMMQNHNVIMIYSTLLWSILRYASQCVEVSSWMYANYLLKCKMPCWYEQLCYYCLLCGYIRNNIVLVVACNWLM